MLKETIKYTDYNGVERTEDFWFHLSKAELMEWEMGTTGGLTEMIKRIVDAQDAPAIIKIFKELVLKAYGQKSPDGKRFIESEELATEFSQTEAYSRRVMGRATGADEAAAVVNGSMARGIAGKAAAAAAAI